jgi:hypothetical protein
VLGAQAFQASLDAAVGAEVPDVGCMLVAAEAAPGPGAVVVAVGAVPTALRIGSRGDKTEEGMGVAEGALLVVRSLRAESGVVAFCRGVVVALVVPCGTGGLAPSRARALCGASIRRRALLSVGFVRSLGELLAAAVRTLYLSVPYADLALMDPLPVTVVLGCLLAAVGAFVTGAVDSFPKIL